ncbi:MAG: PAS domain S-box protein [Chloroflexota bacterium]
MSYRDVTHPDDIQEYLDKNAQLLGGDIREFSIDKRYIRKDGSFVWGNLTMSPLWNLGEEDTPHYLIGKIQDITDRKLTEKALQESEQRFRSLFEQAAVGITLMEANSNHYVNVNQRFCDFLGYTMEEILRMSFLDFTHPDDIQKNLDKNALLFSGKIKEYSFVKRYIRKDGTIFWGNLTMSPLKESDDDSIPCFFIGMVQDITERKQAEEALRQSEELYHLLADNMRDVVWILNPEDMRFRYVSPSVKDHLGFTVEEIMVRSAFETVTEDMQTTLMNKMQDHVEAFLAGKNDTFLDMVEQIHKDGSSVWTEASTHFYYNRDTGRLEVQGVSRNINERRQVEEVLRQSEESYRLLAENMDDVIWVFDLSEMRFRYVSPSVQKISGYTSEEAAEKNINDIIVEEMQPMMMEKMEEHYAAFLAGDNATFIDTVAHRRKDGVPVWTEVSTHFYINPKSGHLEIQGVNRDISERKQVEEVLRQSEELYHLLAENMEDVVSIFDVSEMRFRYISPSVQKISGYTPEETMTQTINETLSEEMQPTMVKKMKEHTAAFLAGENDTFMDIDVHPNKDGVLIWEELSSRFYINPRFGHLEIQGVSRDISARRRAEESLRQFKTIFDIANFGVAITDTNGNLTYINDYFAALQGYQASELLGKSLLRLHSDGQQKLVKRLIRQLEREGHFDAQEVGHCHRDGSTFPMLMIGIAVKDDAGTLQGYAVTAIDISERKKAEEVLQESEKRFRSLFEQAAVGVGIADTRTGHFIRINQRHCDFLGYTMEEMLNKTYLDVTHPDDIQENLDKNAQLLGGEIREFSIDKRYIRKDGSIVWGNLTVSPMWLPLENSIDYYQVSVIQDINERKRAEKAEQDHLANLNALIENTEDRIWAVDSGYRVIISNSAFIKTMKKVLTKDLTESIDTRMDIFSQSLQDAWRGYYDRALGGEIFREEIGNHINGESFYMDYHFSPIRAANNEITGVVISGRDISDRKRKEQILIQSEEDYRVLFESMVQGVVYQNADGMITYGNPAAERILGVSLDQMQGRTSLDQRWRAIHEDGSDFPGETHPSMMAMKTGKNIKDVVMGIYHPLEGKFHWININAVPQFMPGEDKAYRNFSTFEDITERKLLQDSLRKREREVITLIENAPDMIERFDTDLREIYANQEATKQLGISLENLIGKTPLETGIPNYQQSEYFEQMLKKTLEMGIAQEVWQIFSDPPEQRYLLTHIVPERDQHGNIESLLTISRDFTEHKRMEMALQNTLIEKEALLHENHHRVKNNLQVITSLLGLQMSQIHDPEDKVLFEESRNRIQMIAMVHETLVQSNNMAQIYMKDYVGKLTSFVYQSFGAPAYINIELMCENVQLNIDQAMPIGLITNELFTNAFKYAFPEGQPGTIKISLDYLDAEDHKSAEVLLTVADDGVGLPAGWDIKQSGALGLSLVQILTRQLHGTLLVESQGGGTSFSVRFRKMNSVSDKNGDSTEQNG